MLVALEILLDPLPDGPGPDPVDDRDRAKAGQKDGVKVPVQIDHGLFIALPLYDLRVETWG